MSSWNPVSHGEGNRRVTVHTALFREVFWHEYAKIPTFAVEKYRIT